MTYHELISNQEQMEAHWETFSKIWDSLKEGDKYPTIPNSVVRKTPDYKRFCWESHMLDALIDCNADT